MKEYIYLVSQLPDISQAGRSLPITEVYYRDLCNRFIDEKEKALLGAMTLSAPKEATSTGSVFLDAWYENERGLRSSLALVRGQRLKKDTTGMGVGVSGDIVQVARTAVGMDSPLSAEEFLFTYRMSFLDNIWPRDMFSFDAVLAYGIKLMLIQRIKKFDKEKGVDSYHKIYDTILGDAK